MTRKILTIAASALAFSAFAFAPLTAQATSNSTQVFTSAGTSITGNALDSVDVTSVPTSLDFGNFDPESGSSKPFAFGVAFNGAGYTVEFQSSTGSTGTAFELANGSSVIPYTITGNNSGDNTALYANNAAGAKLTDTSPAFTLAVTPATKSTLAAMPAGGYTDTLTVIVTAD
jgi:spore coat protein U-like protein